MRIRRLLALPLAAAGGFAYVRQIHRFRDPVRLPAPQPGELLSPADGMVSFVRHVDQFRAEELDWSVAELFPGLSAPEGWLIGILVGPLDVHYLYQPADGKVGALKHTPGGKDALGKGHLLPIVLGQPADLLDVPGTRSNERLNYTLHTAVGELHVAAVGSLWGLQAISYLQEGDEVQAGHKALFLPEGGLVLAYLPMTQLPAVSVGEKVRGAETVLSRLRG